MAYKNIVKNYISAVGNNTGCNAVVYARYSSQSHQTDQSIEGQYAAAERYAAEHGLLIIKKYADKGISGRSDNRAEFQRMLADSDRRLFDALIVWKTDRIGRNREELAINKARLRRNGVKIVTIAESIPDAPEGVLLESMIEGFAEYFSLQLSENVKRGLKESVKAGKAIGKLPLGYIAGEGRRIEIDEANAGIVRGIFERYVSGDPIKTIIDDLNAKGVRNGAGSAFSYNTIYTILKCRKYIGEYSINGEVVGTIPAIIDAELFGEAEQLMERNRRAPGRVWSHIDYLLTGKLFCGHCESPMVGVCGTSKSGTIHRYYECMGHRRKTCSKKTVRKEWIETEVCKAIKVILYDDVLLREIAKKAYETYEKEKEETQIDKLERDLTQCKREINRLIDAITAGVFNDDIKNRLNALSEQKEKLTEAIEAEKIRAKPPITQDMILFFLYKMRNSDIEDEGQKAALIDAFVNSVYLFDDHIIVNFNLTEGKNGENGKIELKKCSYAISNGVPFTTKTNTYAVFVCGDCLITAIQKAPGN